MSTSNEDLRIRIEQLDGKVNNVQAMVSDLKSIALGVSVLSERIGGMAGNMQSLQETALRNQKWIDDHDRRTREQDALYDTKISDVTDKTAALNNWRNWIMGGLAACSLLIGYAAMTVRDSSARTAELERIVAATVTRVAAVERATQDRK